MSPQQSTIAFTIDFDHAHTYTAERREHDELWPASTHTQYPILAEHPTRGELQIGYVEHIEPDNGNDSWLATTRAGACTGWPTAIHDTEGTAVRFDGLLDSATALYRHFAATVGHQYGADSLPDVPSLVPDNHPALVAYEARFTRGSTGTCQPNGEPPAPAAAPDCAFTAPDQNNLALDDETEGTEPVSGHHGRDLWPSPAGGLDVSSTQDGSCGDTACGMCRTSQSSRLGAMRWRPVTTEQDRYSAYRGEFGRRFADSAVRADQDAVADRTVGPGGPDPWRPPAAGPAATPGMPWPGQSTTALLERDEGDRLQDWIEERDADDDVLDHVGTELPEPDVLDPDTDVAEQVEVDSEFDRNQTSLSPYETVAGHQSPADPWRPTAAQPHLPPPREEHREARSTSTVLVDEGCPDRIATAIRQADAVLGRIDAICADKQRALSEQDRADQITRWHAEDVALNTESGLDAALNEWL